MDFFTKFFNNIKEYILDEGNASKFKENEYHSIINGDSKYKKFSSLFKIPGQGNENVGHKSTLFLDKNLFDDKNYWIVKACDLNRGRCIKMADSISRIRKLVKKFYEGINKDFIKNENEELDTETDKHKYNYNINNNEEIKDRDRDEKKKTESTKYKSNIVIIQKYIEKPFLYRGRKFDIRIWVMINYNQKVYVFREGHLKTSSVNYDSNVRDSYVHITNYSIQKYNEQFSKYEHANEVSFQEFQVN
jgi:hypothetical protein